MTLENDIIQLLQTNDFTVSQIADRLVKKLESISRTLGVMEKKGLIKKVNFNVAGTTVQKKMISLNVERLNELTSPLNNLTSKPLNNYLTKPKEVKLLSPSEENSQNTFEISYPIRNNDGIIVGSEPKEVTQEEAIKLINRLQEEEFLNQGKIYEKDQRFNDLTQRFNELTRQLNDLTNQLTNVKLLSPSISQPILDAWSVLFPSMDARYKGNKAKGMKGLLKIVNNFIINSK